MDTRGIETLLADHPFFEGMSDDHLKLLAGCASNVVFKEKDVIFRHDQEADTFYILRDGKVSVDIVATSQIHRIQTLGAGNVLGWSWLFPPYVWRFDAMAIEPTRAFALDARCLRTKCDTDTVLGYELLKRFSAIVIDRLMAANMRILDMYGGPTEPRTTTLIPPETETQGHAAPT